MNRLNSPCLFSVNSGKIIIKKKRNPKKKKKERKKKAGRKMWYVFGVPKASVVAAN